MMKCISLGDKLVCLCLLAALGTSLGGKTKRNNNAALEECASSAPVVESTVSQIEAECIFADNKQFVRRLAFVESGDGLNPYPCEDDSYHGGIWRVDEHMYDATKAQSGGQYLSSIIASINSQLGIDWTQTTWEDLRMPMYSALGAMLYYTLDSSGDEPPRDLNGQGQFWVDHFEGEDAQLFVELSQHLESNCTDSKTDITFILDSSGSVSRADFDRAKDFVVDVIEGFDVGPDATQFSVIKYSSSVVVEFYLHDYHDKAELINRVNQITYLGGLTDTAAALRRMRTDVFTQSRGARNLQDVPRVGIVVTDGYSNNFASTVQEADACKAANINLMSAGVGPNVNDNELHAMASPPECTNIFHINDYEEMQHLPTTVQEKSCNAPRPLPPGQPLNVTVEPGQVINCVVDVSSDGQSIRIEASSGTLEYYVSYLTYPSEVFFDDRVTATPGFPGYIFIEYTQGDGEQQVVFCAIGSGDDDCTDGCEGEIIGVPEPGPTPCTQVECSNGACVEDEGTWRCTDPCNDHGTCQCGCEIGYGGEFCQIELGENPTYNCQDNIPCTQQNIDNGDLFFAHDEPTMYVMCGLFPGQCYEMTCQHGLVWDDEAKGCNWPPVEASMAQQSSPQSAAQPYDCEHENPCTVENIVNKRFFHRHHEAEKFVMCTARGQCFVEHCPEGSKYDFAHRTCVPN